VQTAGQVDNSQGTPTTRQDGARRAEPVNVWAHAYLVVGTRGRCRLVLVVPSCVFCGRPHAHNGKPDFTTGKRTASCREGRYVLHLGTVEGVAA
jgi:hypothetical protein